MSIQGSCLCGGVRFEVTEPFITRLAVPLRRICKRIPAGTERSSGRARTDAIRILEGAELLRSYTPPGGIGEDVLLRLRLEPLRRRLARVGALRRSPERDRHSSYDRKPEAHNFVRSVAAWEILPDDGLPRYEIRAT